jgi:hypothetical protein
MSSLVQTHPYPLVKLRTELYACTNEQLAWVDALLAALVTYPQDYTTYLAEGDTITVGQPIDQNRSCYTALLLAPPGPVDPPTLGLVGGLPDTILVHQLVGLRDPEIRYAQEHGGALLWQHLLLRGEPVLDSFAE